MCTANNDGCGAANGPNAGVAAADDGPACNMVLCRGIPITPCNDVMGTTREPFGVVPPLDVPIPVPGRCNV